MEELYFSDISSLLTFIVHILSLSPSFLLPLPTHMHAHAHTLTHHSGHPRTAPGGQRNADSLYTALPPESRFLKPKPRGDEMGNIPSSPSSLQIL